MAQILVIQRKRLIVITVRVKLITISESLLYLNVFFFFVSHVDYHLNEIKIFIT